MFIQISPKYCVEATCTPVLPAAVFTVVGGGQQPQCMKEPSWILLWLRVKVADATEKLLVLDITPLTLHPFLPFSVER